MSLFKTLAVAEPFDTNWDDICLFCFTTNGTDKKYWHGGGGAWRGTEAKMSVYQLMFWNSIFLKKAKLNVFLTFFLPKSNTFRQLSPLDRRSLKPTFRQLHFVNKISRLLVTCEDYKNETFKAQQFFYHVTIAMELFLIQLSKSVPGHFRIFFLTFSKQKTFWPEVE